MSEDDASVELLKLELQRRIEELEKKREGLIGAAAFFGVCSVVLLVTNELLLSLASIGMTVAGFYGSNQVKSEIDEVKQKLRRY